ncbi:DUF2325 domain-containing protein [Criibacterium bergeronii]|uniref:DUF2325 domain-containing protein n=1 Tax=Criibacterium bergeronii TaxID=1871336 RepID=A0A371IL04_9FIRM|nr:DUF2325 domain-containing protein [Criibacterium bergeronii]MBS6064042.1 DUF2325 domain-containing protein [Peptostreptococcaceae bacterium]RDY21154.1 DUF2325 domain-containing protein [Criibacterium bergeronii]TRW28265.1 DUF2325 domain-containing protein [Criibacterium bergeronii]
MSVVIIGGLDRMNSHYKNICKKHGCKSKVFTQPPANFQNQIGNPDLIVVFTKTVAHKMLDVATLKAQRTGTAIKYCHSSSSGALDEVLSEHLAC